MNMSTSSQHSAMHVSLNQYSCPNAAYNQANSITGGELGHLSYLRNTRLAGVSLDSPALYIVHVPISSALSSIFF